MTSNLTKILDKEFEEREIKGEIKAKEEDALNFLKLGVSEEIVAKGTEFSTKNYKSFEDETVFSMLAAPKQKGLDIYKR
jgi:hypothetical protein